jgi:protein AATF/BFR2
LRQDATEALLDLADTISTLRLKLMKNDSFANEVKLGQKRTLEDGLNNLRALDAALESHRGAILTKWSRKVNASSGSSALQAAKFKSLNQTAEVQVRSMLADMDRLVKRTRLNRSNVTILGQDLSVGHQNGSNHLVENDHIFDDTDFYRLLLKDLVDKRMADSGAAAGLKWTAVKTKVKKNVDTKASKGRRLRYHVQEKIQGFDVPRPVFTWTDDQVE